MARKWGLGPDIILAQIAGAKLPAGGSTWLTLEIAMARYHKEYAPSDQNWSYLYGLTLLKLGSYQQAASQLSLVQLDRARALGLTSRLRAGRRRTRQNHPPG